MVGIAPLNPPYVRDLLRDAMTERNKTSAIILYERSVRIDLKVQMAAEIVVFTYTCVPIRLHAIHLISITGIALGRW